MQAQREKTTFQTPSAWRPTIDLRSDAVMLYGAESRPGQTFSQRVQSWRERGYTVHYMTGIAWGGYSDYFTGQWDGKWHLDEGQKEMNGDTIFHHPSVPYIVPSRNYLEYFKEKHIRPVIDAGVDAIFLEVPEFWTRAGYSESFKREWQEFYGFPWRPPHESAENTYLSNKLKYHLYYRALDEVFTYAKEYGRKRGMNVRCYVPTHSLINYTRWGIVSPEASLASMESCDGYIAQVWTGTARSQNSFNVVSRERVFEGAFLEYGCMESMTRPTGRKMFFLTDPVEDRAVDWADYKQNYQATFVAQLLYPQNNNYEVMPWPERVYEGTFRLNAQSDERVRIPHFYSTQVQTMVNTLNDMPLSNHKVSGSHGISVLMANSLMFQHTLTSGEQYSDPKLSGLFGLTLPLLKRGVPVGITHLENVSYPETWKDVKVLLMTYFNMKPLSPDAHRYIAEWVKRGGRLIYCGRDNDAYQTVLEWWNQDGNHYSAPSQHLFSLMQMPEQAAEGVYRYGKGRVCVIRQDPKEFALNANGDVPLMARVNEMYGALELKNDFRLERGPYLIAAVVDEGMVSNEPLTLEGSFIDLFDSTLPCLSRKVVQPGEQAFLYDLRKVKHKKRPQVVASASRQYDEIVSKRSYTFTAKGPAEIDNVMRVLLPQKPTQVEADTDFRSEWDAGTHTLLLCFGNRPDGVHVKLGW